MSAILAVRKQGSIELLTDSAAICGGTGKVLYFGKKQIATAIPACAIGATGAVRTCFEFERLLTGISAFDSLIERAAELWHAALSNSAEVAQYGGLIGFQALALAGWSKQREQLELYSLTSDESGLSENLTTLAATPTSETSLMLLGFIDALEADIEAFTSGDGIALFERLRRYPRQFADTKAPAVGGEIYQTTVTRNGTFTRTIHAWPDRVGEQIAC